MAQVAPQHRERQLRPSRGVSGRRDGPGFRRLRESDYQLPGGCVARFCLRHKDGEAACVLIAREPLVNRTVPVPEGVGQRGPLQGSWPSGLALASLSKDRPSKPQVPVPCLRKGSIGVRLAADTDATCGCSSMVEHQLPKLTVRVRFPSSAPLENAQLAPCFPGSSAKPSEAVILTACPLRARSL